MAIEREGPLEGDSYTHVNNEIFLMTSQVNTRQQKNLARVTAGVRSHYEGFIGFWLQPAYGYFIFAPGIIFEDRRARMIMIARSKEHVLKIDALV